MVFGELCEDMRILLNRHFPPGLPPGQSTFPRRRRMRPAHDLWTSSDEQKRFSIDEPRLL
jgi:hypothetical protein